MAGQNIQQLPSTTIRRIGSGQVIISVYSVVKELFENAFDAGATTLDVKLDDYGLEKIEVSDNGFGIKLVDIPFVAKRHYTSKLVTTDDLLSLNTYGFRGEALASLCAVSDTIITTKTVKEDVAYTYTFDSEGNVKTKKPSHLGIGTIVTACNLFGNLPVRKQFYQSSQRREADLEKIKGLLLVFGIIKPQARITLRHNRTLIWQKMPVSDTRGGLQAVLGRQIVSQLIYCQKALDVLQGLVSVYLPKPGSDIKTMSRSSNDRTFFVVNERPVFIKDFLKVLKQYYNCHACETNRYPLCYVCIKLPGSYVDVNVDPNKTTVFLQHMSEVRRCMEEILVEIYGPLDNVPSWHYIEAVKKTNESCDRKDVNCHTIRSSDTREVSPLLGKTVDSSNLSQDNIPALDLPHATILELTGDDVTSSCRPLPSFTVTFHQPENLSCQMDKTQTFNSSEKEKHTLQKCKLQDDRSLISSNGNNLLGSVQENETATASCSDPLPDSTYNSDFSCVNQPQSDLIPCGGTDHSVDDNNLSKCNIQETFPEKLQGSINMTEDHGESALDNEELATRGNNWSMGYSILDVHGKPLQPVQLLPAGRKAALGKRLSSPADDLGHMCPLKRTKLENLKSLPANQPTLHTFSIKSTLPDLELYCQEKRHTISDLNPGLSEEEINEQKNKSCDDQMPACEIGKSSKGRKSLQLNVQAKTTTVVSQNLGGDKEKRTLRQRLYHCEKELDIDLKFLRSSIKNTETQKCRTSFSKPVVIGQAKSCDAWFCCHGNSLYIINIHRLAEITVYRKLKEKHIFFPKPYLEPLDLDFRKMSNKQWSSLEQLALLSQTDDTYFHIRDDRLLANGFDVRCHWDVDHKLKAELVGLCDLIPSYDVNDLYEVLEKINLNQSEPLEDTRPIKAIFYLQGEAARVVQINVGKKSIAEVQCMLDPMTEITDAVLCIHQRPVFHNLFNFTEV